MNLGRQRLRLAGVAALAALAVTAAGCSSSSSSGGTASNTGGQAVKGGTATVALQPDVTLSWIFPFYSITNSSVYNSEQFQWLMYRPLYMFGNNTGNDVGINYPLSPADKPVYSNGGKTVTVTMKGWKWSNGEAVDAKSVIFFMNMVEAETPNWYAAAPGLLPANVTSYKATGPDTVQFNTNKPYSSTWFTYNQLAELTPMPLSWDVTSLTGAPGSGGCTTDSKADNWAKCKAVYNFLNAQAKQSATFATSKLWSVVDGPWKLQTYSSQGNVTMVPNKAYSGSPKPTLAAVKFVPYTSDTTEYTALKTGGLDVGYVPPADLAPRTGTSALPPTNPLGTAYNLQPFYNFGIEYAQPNFNNPQVGFMIRQLYMRQALQESFDQLGIDKAIYRGYATPTSGPAPNTPPGNQWESAVEQENNQQGPYPFNLTKAKALLTSHGWAMKGGIMTCEDPAKCGTGIKKGQQAVFKFLFSTGQAAVTAEWQQYKSDASKIGIDIDLVGQTFNTIVGQSAPCAPMSAKCAVQVFAFGGWSYNGPGFEPTGEPLFATGAGSNSGNYSNPTMDSLITATHTSNAKSAFSTYANYGAKQLPFIFGPNPYQIEAVNSGLKGVTFNALYTLLPEYWHFTKK